MAQVSHAPRQLHCQGGCRVQGTTFPRLRICALLGRMLHCVTTFSAEDNGAADERSGLECARGCVRVGFAFIVADPAGQLVCCRSPQTAASSLRYSLQIQVYVCEGAAKSSFGCSAGAFESQTSLAPTGWTPDSQVRGKCRPWK